ncbi:MAG: T9SS type A sorting domain-containing protein [Bacteroidetes bacterium]|nr:T9SS type A sorting domain-containing protein [Bacteroidota bacterium]
MKKFLLNSLLLFSGIITAQTEFKCGFLEANEYLFKEDRTAKKRFDDLIKAANELDSKGSLQKSALSTYTIPVVFHILHLGGSENISDAQITDAMKILNRDFAKKNADTTNIINQYKPIAADCQIEFKLASLDENGQCTNGITRHYTVNTDWTPSFSNYIYTWDRTKYMNVYVVKTMQAGAAGYTYLPGTASANADAIVLLHNYTGSMGTANPFTSRTLTHETGHWFNLQHVWGSTNQPGVACGDDGVTDTPVTKGHTNCSLGSAVCSSGVVENVQNYMEYAYCSRMFTQGQKTRMHNCIIGGIAGRDNLSSNGNLIATGLINPITTCAPKAEFVSDPVTCIGNTLNFTDYSYNAPVTTWLWSSPSTANTSTLQNGVLSFTNSGLATVKLKVGNAFGEDSITKQNVIVLAGTNSGTLNLTQGFETLFPDNNWIASIPQFGGAFKTNTVTAATGTNCAWIDNFYDNPNVPVSIYSPLYNLQNLVSTPQFEFKYAYAQQATNNNDVLKVFVSINCGSTWVQLFSKTGTQLSTTGSVITTAYLNPQPAHWKTEMLSLASYQGSQQVAFKIEFTPNGGNNVYVDDINVTGTVGLKENSSVLNEVFVYPNPFSNKLSLKGNEINKINSIQLFDILGKEIVTELKANNEELKIINVESVNAGIYFLKLNSAEGSKTVKIIKQ